MKTVPSAYLYLVTLVAEGTAFRNHTVFLLVRGYNRPPSGGGQLELPDYASHLNFKLPTH